MRFGKPSLLIIGSTLLALAGDAQPAPQAPSRSVVFFQQDGITLDPSADQVIQQVAQTAGANPNLVVHVTAFGGTAYYPQNAGIGSFAAKRADVVTRVLVRDGVQPGRIRTATHNVDIANLPVQGRRVEIDLVPGS
jgi:outer membrane protein OmpA-like peptidoglycan-associated protein